jgi:hypothetical protein
VSKKGVSHASIIREAGFNEEICSGRYRTNVEGVCHSVVASNTDGKNPVRDIGRAGVLDDEHSTVQYTLTEVAIRVVENLNVSDGIGDCRRTEPQQGNCRTTKRIC